MRFTSANHAAMQRPRAFWLVALTAATIAASVVLLLVSKSKNPARVHLDAIEALERSWTAVETLEKIKEHTQALVDLGYFETRTFPLQRRIWDKAAHAQFRSLYSNAPFSDRHGILSATGESNATVLIITARPRDLDLWSNLVWRFEASDAP